MVVDTCTWMRNALYLAQSTQRTQCFLVVVVDICTWMRNALYLAQRTQRPLSFLVVVGYICLWMRGNYARIHRRHILLIRIIITPIITIID
jgi:hypothetical protein